MGAGMEQIKNLNPPRVGVIMGSISDWDTMKEACSVLNELEVAYEKHVVSAHRTPQWLAQYSEEAEGKGLQVIVAGAGGAAHLPGMVASHTLLPVIGVPVRTSSLNGMDSLFSIVQMPRGVPVATVAIGGAIGPLRMPTRPLHGAHLHLRLLEGH